MILKPILLRFLEILQRIRELFRRGRCNSVLGKLLNAIIDNRLTIQARYVIFPIRRVAMSSGLASRSESHQIV